MILVIITRVSFPALVILFLQGDFMKKSFITILIINILALTACEKKQVLGEDLIENARKSYEKLNSATVVVTDLDSGELLQTFSFNYKENGDMVYLYEGILGDEKYIEYNNAEALFTKKNGEITKQDKNSRDFKKFTKKEPHPDATGDLILFTKSYVQEAKITNTESGKVLVHKYNTSKLQKLAESVGKIEDFIVTYNFDNEGNLMNFIETTVLENDSKSFKIEITEKNQIVSIEKPSELI